MGVRKYRRGILLAIKGAGFISNKLLNSNMTLDVAYTLYLILASTPEIPKDQIKRFVQKLIELVKGGKGMFHLGDIVDAVEHTG